MDFIFEKLGVEPGAVWMTGLRIHDWGREIVFDCLYGDALAFRLRFTDCREIKWRVYVHAAGELRASLGEARFGRGGHRVAAHLLTDFFGVSLLYGDLQVDWDD